MLFSKFMLIVDATGAGYDGHWSVALVSEDDLHLRLALTYKIQNNSAHRASAYTYNTLTYKIHKDLSHNDKSHKSHSAKYSTGVLDLLNDVSGACCIMVL